MKKRQRRIAALLLACAVASVPVSQAFAETTYDVAAGVDAQIPVSYTHLVRKTRKMK